LSQTIRRFRIFVDKIGDKIGGKIFVIDVPVAVDLTTKK
jgi:hypothetical protein